MVGHNVAARMCPRFAEPLLALAAFLQDVTERDEDKKSHNVAVNQ